MTTPATAPMTLSSLNTSLNPFQIEAERNSAIEALVRTAKRHGILDQCLGTLRANPELEVPTLAFGRFDRSLNEFAIALDAAAERPEAEELIAESRRRAISLSEIVAERFAPESLKTLRAWYAAAGEAVRHEIRLSWPDGIRTRFLAVFPAESDDPRAIHYKTYGYKWGRDRSAVVLWVDLVRPEMTPDSFGTHPLIFGTLAGFLVEQAARVLTAAVFTHNENWEKTCRPLPKIRLDETGEMYFRRIADDFASSNTVKISANESSFTVLRKSPE